MGEVTLLHPADAAQAGAHLLALVVHLRRIVERKHRPRDRRTNGGFSEVRGQDPVGRHSVIVDESIECFQASVVAHRLREAGRRFLGQEVHDSLQAQIQPRVA